MHIKEGMYTSLLSKLAEYSASNNLALGISIFDANGVELFSMRQSESFPVSLVFARSKALTSATLRLKTSDIATYSAEGKPYYQIESLSGGQFTTIAGGVPIVDASGVHHGGVGVGGSADTSQDEELATILADILVSQA